VVTGANGFWISVEEYGDAGGGLAGMMKGEGVHTHHDIRLGMVEPVVENSG
jgi:hypothetical protein